MQELGVQKSPQGIAALSMGNPAPLQQRVQQAGKDPQTGLPKDLVDALALNIVTNEQDAAKRQMAMQQLQQAAGPTGQMPTVVQGLQQQAQQKMAALQQKAMMDAQAQQAAQRPGIDQLPAEFAMADGGIVAFDGTDGSVPKADKAQEEDFSEYATVPKLVAETAVPSYLYRVAKDVAERTGTSVGQILKSFGKEGIAAVGRGAGQLGTAAVEGGAGAGVLTGGALATQLAGNVARGMSPEQREAYYSSPMMGALSGDQGFASAIMNESKPVQEAKAAAQKPEAKPYRTYESTPTGAGPRSAAGIAAAMPNLNRAPAPSAGNVGGPSAAGAGGAGGAGGAPRETMDPMEKVIRDSIMKTMGLKDDDEYKKGVDRFNQTVGIDALLKDMSDRAAAREARFEKAKAERMPDWVKALQAMSGAPIRGGIGMMLGQMGGAAANAREAYGAEDLAFAKEIDALRDKITVAKLEGNYKAAAAGEDALKNLVANKRQAESSGTSLLNTQEQVRARKQMAADAAAARAQVAQARQDQLAQANDMKKLAQAESAFERDPEVKSLLKSLELAPDESSKAAAYRRMRQIQREKYLQAGVQMVDTGSSDQLSSAPPTGGKSVGKV